MGEFDVVKLPNGAVRQASVQKTPATSMPNRANGLLLRGIVVATYVKDDPIRSSSDNWRPEANPGGTYCDVLIVTTRREGRLGVLQKVLVSQEASGMHTGKPWIPRASSFAVVPGGGPTEPFDPSVTNPAQFDGDHVLVGFLDDSLAMPVILRALPHPLADLGNDSTDIGTRVDFKLVDGNSSFARHNGVVFGVDGNGDVLFDTRYAYDGNFISDGTEPPPAADGSHGNANIKMQEGSKINIEIGGGQTLHIELADGNTKMTLGDGARSVTLAENLQSFYENPGAGVGIKGTFDLHIHNTAVGPTSVPTVPMPAWDSSINSTKAKVPNG